MNCNEIREFCSDYLDCCLGDKQEVFELHLMQCPACKSNIEQMRKILAALRCLKEINVPADFIVRLNERIDQEKGSAIKRFLSATFLHSANKMVAIAATIIFVLLGALFIANQNASHETETLASISTNTTSRRLSSGAPSLHAEGPSPQRTGVEMTALAPSQPPARTPRSNTFSTPVAIKSSIGETVDVANLPSPLTPTKALYVDAVVFLKTTNPSTVADSVRRLTQRANGNYLDYSETIIFVQIPVQIAEPYLQALDSLGSLEITAGPIDRGLPTLLFQVIVLPSR